MPKHESDATAATKSFSAGAIIKSPPGDRKTRPRGYPAVASVEPRFARDRISLHNILI